MSEIIYRDLSILGRKGVPASIDVDNRSVEVIGATEDRVKVYDWQRDCVIDEVLLMDGCQLPESRQVPLLDSHSRWSTADVIGSYRDITPANGSLTGRAVYSDLAEDAWKKTREGHLTDYSVGYSRDEVRWIEKNLTESVAGREFEGPVLVVTRWTLKELSACPVGADPRAKARNDKNIDERIERSVNDALKRAEETRIMDEKEKKEQKEQQREAPKVDVNAAMIAERDRILNINSVVSLAGERCNLRDAADEAILNGTSLDDFRAVALERMSTAKPIGQKSGNIGMSEREIESYSFRKAIMAHATQDWSRAGLEHEASLAMEAETKRSPKGFFAPPDVLDAKRDLTTANTGQYVVGTDVLTGSFIELLRNKMKVRGMGATVLSGLVGDLAIPKQTGSATMYWIGEGDDLTESAQTLGQIGLTPKTAGAFVDLSRKLLMQSSIDIENFIRMDLALTLAIGIDLAALHGTGIEKQPRGLENVPGINTVSMGDNSGDPTWAKIVAFETAVATANADEGDMGFLTNAKVRGHCKTIEKASNTAKFLWSDDGTMNGYRAEVSNQVKATYTKGSHTDADLSAIFFGNWRQLIIGQWGGLDILTDPYTLSTQGAIRTLVFQDVDIQCRQASAFAFCNDCQTS